MDDYDMDDADDRGGGPNKQGRAYSGKQAKGQKGFASASKEGFVGGSRQTAGYSGRAYANKTQAGGTRGYSSNKVNLGTDGSDKKWDD